MRGCALKPLLLTVDCSTITLGKHSLVISLALCESRWINQSRVHVTITDIRTNILLLWPSSCHKLPQQIPKRLQWRLSQHLETICSMSLFVSKNQITQQELAKELGHKPQLCDILLKWQWQNRLTCWLIRHLDVFLKKTAPSTLLLVWLFTAVQSQSLAPDLRVNHQDS